LASSEAAFHGVRRRPGSDALPLSTEKPFSETAAIRRCLPSKRFSLVAKVSSSNPKAIRPVLEQLIGSGRIEEVGGEYSISGGFIGASAKDLNRSVLSALRRAEKKTRLRAEWTSEDGTTSKFFDYVLKKTVRSSRSP